MDPEIFQQSCHEYNLRIWNRFDRGTDAIMLFVRNLILRCVGRKHISPRGYLLSPLVFRKSDVGPGDELRHWNAKRFPILDSKPILL